MPVPMSMTPPSWPPETDLVFTPGSNKIMLTKQQDLVHLVLQDSFETLRATLLLENAFPNPSLQASFVKDSLLSSAKAHMPGAASVLMRLQNDPIYLRKLLPVVSLWSPGLLDLAGLKLSAASCPYPFRSKQSQRALQRTHQCSSFGYGVT